MNRNRNKDEKKIGKIRLDEASEAADGSDFGKLSKLAASLQDGGANPLAGLGSGGAGDMFAGMGEFWDQLMESDEMRAIMDDPQLLRETISNNPLLKAMPGVGDQVEELLNSEAFQDPAALKAVMKQGMDAFKDAGSEFGKEFGKQMEMMMSDPEGFQKNMADAMAQLIPGGAAGGGDAILEAAKGLFDGSGNFDAAALAKIPGAPPAPHFRAGRPRRRAPRRHGGPRGPGEDEGADGRGGEALRADGHGPERARRPRERRPRGRRRALGAGLRVAPTREAPGASDVDTRRPGARRNSGSIATRGATTDRDAVQAREHGGLTWAKLTRALLTRPLARGKRAGDLGLGGSPRSDGDARARSGRGVLESICDAHLDLGGRILASYLAHGSVRPAWRPQH